MRAARRHPAFNAPTRVQSHGHASRHVSPDGRVPAGLGDSLQVVAVHDRLRSVRLCKTDHETPVPRRLCSLRELDPRTTVPAATPPTHRHECYAEQHQHEYLYKEGRSPTRRPKGEQRDQEHGADHSQTDSRRSGRDHQQGQSNRRHRHPHDRSAVTCLCGGCGPNQHHNGGNRDDQPRDIGASDRVRAHARMLAGDSGARPNAKAGCPRPLSHGFVSSIPPCGRVGAVIPRCRRPVCVRRSPGGTAAMPARRGAPQGSCRRRCRRTPPSGQPRSSMPRRRPRTAPRGPQPEPRDRRG